MTRSSRRWAGAMLIEMLVAPLGGFGSLGVLFSQGKHLWQRWTANDPSSTARIDHAVWSGFLETYLIKGPVNRIRYAAVTPTDRAALDAYVARLGTIPIGRYRREEQLAYWIDLYN